MLRTRSYDSKGKSEEKFAPAMCVREENLQRRDNRTVCALCATLSECASRLHDRAKRSKRETTYLNGSNALCGNCKTFQVTPIQSAAEYRARRAAYLSRCVSCREITDKHVAHDRHLHFCSAITIYSALAASKR